MTHELLHGDCLEVMAAMDAGSVDAVVCDPPYGLEFMGKEWDRLGATSAAFDESLTEDGRVDYHGKGNAPFGGGGKRVRYGSSAATMQSWHQAWAAEALRVLKPSHYLLAFGGTRTWHRLACAIEDAGFEIRDNLTRFWCYGSGFPKGKSCLKPAHEPVIVAQKPATVPQHIQTMLDIIDERNRQWQADGYSEAGMSPATLADVDIALSTILSWKLTLADVCDTDERTSTTSATTAQTTDWKTLSFCLSQITLADIIQEPTLPNGLSASASDAARYFSAELARLAATRELSALAPAIEAAHISYQDEAGPQPNWTPIILARKPGPMRELGIDSCRIPAGGESPTALRRSYGYTPNLEKAAESEARGELRDRTDPEKKSAPHPSDDLGRWPANLILECTCDETRDGTAKTGTAVRHNSGGKTFGTDSDKPPMDDMSYAPNGKEPVRIHTDPNCPCAMLDGQTGDRPSKMGGSSPASSYWGQGGGCEGQRRDDSGGASRFFYAPKASRAERGEGNTHPTVKNLALMRWLVKLVAYPGDTVLDPFMGSGTTGVACAMEGREFIGIEREAEYIEIARRRIEHASAQGRLKV